MPRTHPWTRKIENSSTEKNYQQASACHVSFITRKGFVDGSRRSPGFASKDASFRFNIRFLQSAFPGFASDRLRCPRLQLRGSAGFSPASHSTSIELAYDHARTKFLERSKQQVRKFNPRAAARQPAHPVNLNSALHIWSRPAYQIT